MRYAEYALLAVPVGLAVAWLCGVRGLSRNGMVALVVALGVFAGVLFWLGEGRSFTGRYVPARLHDGTILPGHPG